MFSMRFRSSLRPRSALLGLLCMLAVGCAQLPDAKVTYYLSKTEVRFNVVSTVACDKSDHLLVAYAVSSCIRRISMQGRCFPWRT